MNLTRAARRATDLAQLPAPADPTRPSAGDPIADMWYFALAGHRLRRGRTVGMELLGRPVLVGRDRAGAVFALHDRCPHRGIPLSHGKFDGTEVECCYHGWRFDCSGTCTHIPSLLPTQTFEPGRVKAGSLPCREVQGNVWVFVPGVVGPGPHPLPDPPAAPDVDGRHYCLYESARFRCTIDQAVAGLVDPAHGPFVHKSWFWRSGKRLKEKAKAYAPSDLGFTMVRHTPSSNSKVYRRLFGGDATVEIGFRLPGVRTEHIRAGRHHVVGMTCLTPLGDTEVELHQLFYATAPWLRVVVPFLRPLVRRFIGQDRDVMEKQGALTEDTHLMLINDADKPIRWYLRVKEELLRSRAEGRAFANPVPETTLRWRT
jgi:phenylpropionate dioxygenase-like ring-hydroxylating dioxygenase large terminal subunit